MANAVLLCSPVRIGWSSLGSHAAMRARRPRVRAAGARRDHSRACGIVPFLQLGGQLQQPGQAVGPLEAAAAVRGQVLHLLRDVGRRQALRHRAPRVRRERRLRKQARQPHQQPVPVDRGVPVVAAVERRSQFARRLHVGIGIQRVRDLVGVLLVDAVERHAGKSRRLRLVEPGSGHETSARGKAEHGKPEHLRILAQPRRSRPARPTTSVAGRRAGARMRWHNSPGPRRGSYSVFRYAIKSAFS